MRAIITKEGGGYGREGWKKGIERGKKVNKRRNVVEFGNLKERAGPGQVVAIYLVEGPGISHSYTHTSFYLFLSRVSFLSFFFFWLFKRKSGLHKRGKNKIANPKNRLTTRVCWSSNEALAIFAAFFVVVDLDSPTTIINPVVFSFTIFKPSSRFAFNVLSWYSRLRLVFLCCCECERCVVFIFVWRIVTRYILEIWFCREIFGFLVELIFISFRCIFPLVVLETVYLFSMFHFAILVWFWYIDMLNFMCLFFPVVLCTILWLPNDFISSSLVK